MGPPKNSLDELLYFLKNRAPVILLEIFNFQNHNPKLTGNRTFQLVFTITKSPEGKNVFFLRGVSQN